MGEQRPSAGFLVKTSDLVKPIQNNHDKKDVYLSLLMRRIDKAFEFPPTLSQQQSLCGFPGEIANSSIIDEITAFRDDLAVKAILIVATILENLEVIRKDCWELLEAIYKFAKSFHQLKDFPILNNLHKMKNVEADPLLSTIFSALRRCFFRNKRKEHGRFELRLLKYKKNTEKYLSLVNEVHKDLGTQMLAYILRSEQRWPEKSDEEAEAESKAEVKTEDEVITQKKMQVSRLLFLEKEKPSAAVILRGLCKTNVGDAIYDHLKDKLFENGFKFAKVKVAENLESNRDKKGLQRQLLDDLRGKNNYSGKKTRHLLRDTIKREPVFIYVDNVLSVQDFRSVLDMKSMQPKKLRLLVTSPNDTVLSALQKCGFEPTEPDTVLSELPKCGFEPTESVENNPEIGIKCSIKNPLLPEMVTTYLKRCKWATQRKRCEGADEKTVRDWFVEDNLMETGFRFALENAFLNLKATAQEAFLDICSFFLGWDFHEVSFIVGEAELETLEENAWVKRNPNDQIAVLDRALKWGLSRTKGVRLTSEEELKKAVSSDEMVKQIRGIWLPPALVRTEEKPVEIPAKTFELMRDSLRVLLLERVTVVPWTKSPENVDMDSISGTGPEQVALKGRPKKFQNMRFLQVDRCTLPFRLNQLCNLQYLSCGDDVDFNDEERKYSIEEEIKDLRNHTRRSKLDMRTLKLKTFHMSGTSKSNVFRPFPKLRELSINIWNEMTLPESLSQLYFLQKLDLHDCKYLQDLPNSFGNLRCLAKLDLGYCQSLRRLPETFGELQSLEEVILSYCVALEQLPASFVWLGRLKKATFSHCHSLQKLPPRFELLTSLQEVDFSFCKNLELLPTNFQLLSSLKLLNIEGCEKLVKLPDTFPESLLKSEWVAVKLCGCSGLIELPDEFCQGNQIEDLSLADCSKLQMLPGEINELKQLKKLNLSGCKTLAKLPKTFSELASLEVLNLSSCEKLSALCKGFNRLTALKDLNVSRCRDLEGKWMRKLVKIQSLRLVDIRGSEKLQERWLHSKMQYGLLDRKRWSQFTVLTDQTTNLGKPKEDLMQTTLDDAASKFFEEKTILMDPYGRRFFPSRQISPDTNLAFIFDRNISRWDWEMLENNVDELIQNLSGMRIIYVGTSFSAIPSKLAEKVSAYTPENCPALSLFDKQLAVTAGADFWVFGTYIIIANVVKHNKGYKYFKEWGSISGKLITGNFKIEDSRNFITEILAHEKDNPREVNVKLLEALCKTKETDLVVDQGNKVTFSYLQGKVVFLLISTLEISKKQISFFKAIYENMRQAKDKQRSLALDLLWVWVPVVHGDKDKWFRTYSQLEGDMRWAVISDPRLIDQSSVKLFLRERLAFYETPILVGLFDGFANSLTNVMPIVAALGLRAFLFFIDSWYSPFDYNEKLSMSGDPRISSFLFPNLSEIKKDQLTKSQMIWLYGGDHDMISEFNQKLMSVSEKADIDMIQILYMGDGNGNDKEEEEDFYVKDADGFPGLKLCNVQKFWNHAHYLVYLKACMSTWISVKSSRRILLGLLSLHCLSRSTGTVWMMAMDGTKNEILTAKGKDLVDLLSSNIEMSRNSLISIGNGAVEVLSSKSEPDQSPWIRIAVTIEGQEKNSDPERTTFEDDPWLTAHPSSHLIEQTPDYPFCSICYGGSPAYQCSVCHCFTICEQCHSSEEQRAEQIYVERA